MPSTASTHKDLGAIKQFPCGGREADDGWLCASKFCRHLTAQRVWHILLIQSSRKG